MRSQDLYNDRKDAFAGTTLRQAFCPQMRYAFAGIMLSQEPCLCKRCLRKMCAFAGVLPSQTLYIRRGRTFARRRKPQELCRRRWHTFARGMPSHGSCAAIIVHSQGCCLSQEVCIRRKYALARRMPSQTSQVVCLRGKCIRKAYAFARYAFAGIKPAQEICIRRSCLRRRCAVCKSCAFSGSMHSEAGRRYAFTKNMPSQDFYLRKGLCIRGRYTCVGTNIRRVCALTWVVPSQE